MLYAILRSVASLALRWYYRGIEVLGLERFPAHGPAILVANHWNALVDALIIGTAVRRPVRLTAKATLLEHPVTRLLVRALGIIPLRRASDETHGDVPVDHSRNANAFTAVLDALEHGEVVLIFPEGRSHSEPSLAPLKSGAARLALMARSERGLADIPIIPIGLTFEHKERPRSRVMMHVGPPITADSPLRIPAGLSTPPQTSGANPSAQVQALTAQIDDALRQLTLNFPTPEDAERVRDVATILTQVLDRVRPIGDPDPPLSEATRVAQRLELARRRLSSNPPEILTAANAFVRRLDAFRARAKGAQVPVNDLWLSLSPLAGAVFIARELAIALASLPLALWGRINHWLPLSLARYVGRATSRHPDEPAMHTLVSGLVFVLAFYALIAIAIARAVGGWWALAYLLLLPPAATLDFWISGRLHRAAVRARAYIILRRDASLRDTLLQEARELRAEARRLDAVLS